MIGETRLLNALQALVKRTRADGMIVCAQPSTRRVFRFAYNAIHQDVRQETVNLTVKVIRNGRVGVASTETLEPLGLRRCAQAALNIATHSPKPSELPDLPANHRLRSRTEYAPATARLSAAMCVETITRLFHICHGAGAKLAGSLITGEDEIAVANSAGVASYAASTVAGIKLVTMYRDLSGYAAGAHHRFDHLDVDRLLRRSLRQCLHRIKPVTVPLGTYEVILEPDAVAELVDWLGSIAFSARSLQERTSFLTGRIGEQLAHRALTIYDDGNDPETLRIPFDCEGVPKQRTLLLDRGKAAGVVYDSVYGKRSGRPSTGHSVSLDEADGPYPMHLGILPGTVSTAEMIRSCKRGLLIPRFHYVSGLLNPREALMTGLLREGAMLVEHGKIVAPVTRMRFTQSLVEAFRHIKGISKQRRLVADPSTGSGSHVMPTLHLRTFTFTGRSIGES